MIKFFRLIIILSLTLTSMIIAARLIGASKPLHPNLLLQTMFTNPDGSPCQKPCLFGIHPGIVQQVGDQTRLAQFPWVRDAMLSNGDLSGWFDIDGQGTTFFANSLSYVAFYIEIRDDFVPQSQSFPQPTLEDVIAAMGMPTNVRWTDNELDIRYASGKVFVVFNTTKNVTNNILSDQTVEMETVKIFASGDVVPNDLVTYKWRGFVKSSLYP